jgi:serine/threonine-protein kinase
MGSGGLTFGPFTFDPGNRLLTRHGVELALPPRVLGVLEVLLRRAGEVVPRQELIDSVWKDAFVTDTSLAEAVSVLRQALGDDPQSPAYIQTFHRRGYRFVAPVADTGTATFSGESGVEKSSVRVSPSIGGQLVPWSVAAICAILAAVAVREAVKDREAAAPPVLRMTITPAPGTRFDTRAPSLALSPDASRVVWSGCGEPGEGCRLYVRDSDRLDATPIAGTDDAAAPFFSPDGRWLGFFADGHLKKVPLAGGAPVTLTDAADALGGVWTDRREIVYAGAAAGLSLIPDSGGESLVLTRPRVERGEVRHVWPSYHRPASLLLFTVTGIPGIQGTGRLAVSRLDRPSAGWTTLMGGMGRAAAIADDVLVLSHGSELQAVAWDVQRNVVSGAPRTVVGELATSGGTGHFAVAPVGALLALTATTTARRPLVWWTFGEKDGAGRSEEAARVRELESVSLSPDGRRMAGIDRADPSRPDVWITDLERGTASRLTHDGFNAAPVWSRDGGSVFFASSDGGVFGISTRDADALRPVTKLYSGAEHAIPSSLSPDGRQLAFVSHGPTTRADLWLLPIEGGTPSPFIRTPFDDVAGTFSPDGRLVAYQSNESGRWEIYVHRRADARRITVSTDGGTDPFWSADGRALFFRSRGRLMRAGVSPDGSSVGIPAMLNVLGDAIPIGTDAKGRVLFQRQSEAPAEAAVLTLQWLRELRQLLGPPSAVMPR